MISRDEAIRILRKYIQIEGVINHSIGTAEVGFEIAAKIKENGKNIEPEKVWVACLLHDIGRAKDGVHEINTAEILNYEKLKDIAEISVHGFVYENFLNEGVKKEELLPKTLEHKIVVLSDFYFSQKRMNLDERFQDLEERYKNDEKFIKAMNLARSRIYELEKEIIDLID